MGQEEVKNILERARGWLLSREIANLAKISLGSVQSSLQRMIKWGEVEARKAREVIKDKNRIRSNHPSFAYRLKDSEEEGASLEEAGKVQAIMQATSSVVHKNSSKNKP
ncbi:hypothetical protein J4430_00245 [Candidatus Woesearchaeota archaeon]|nr:hypothetical protein [Candidatus Woesearchaeota archaeon]